MKKYQRWNEICEHQNCVQVAFHHSTTEEQLGLHQWTNKARYKNNNMAGDTEQDEEEKQGGKVKQ